MGLELRDKISSLLDVRTFYHNILVIIHCMNVQCVSYTLNVECVLQCAVELCIYIAGSQITGVSQSMQLPSNFLENLFQKENSITVVNYFI